LLQVEAIRSPNGGVASWQGKLLDSGQAQEAMSSVAPERQVVAPSRGRLPFPFSQLARFFRKARFWSLVALVLTSAALRRLCLGPKRPSWSFALEMVLAFVRTSAIISPPSIEAIDRIRRAAGRPPKIRSRVKIQMVRINDSISGEWVEHITARESPYAMLYLHGGAYFMLSSATHRGITSKFSKLAHVKVIAIDYRLAPEHPFPAGLDDAFSTYSWLIDPEGGGYQPQNVVIGGDSAGGGLTLALIIRLRDSGLPLPAAAVCLSPWVDLECRGESWKTNQNYDYLQMPDTFFNIPQMYAGAYPLNHPLISPLHASLAGLPPLLIQAGEVELLRDDAVMFAEKAKKEGVDVTLEIYTDMFHVFQAFGSLAAKSQEAFGSAAAFIQTYVGLPSTVSGHAAPSLSISSAL
jgi:monoterpene epsilon-lactone hydrolase